MTLNNCNNSTISTHTSPLSFREVQHLYRRIGFSTDVDTINNSVNMMADDLVDSIIDEAANYSFINKPAWANWDINDYPDNNQEASQLIVEQYENLKYDYIEFLKNSNLIGRLNFFWSNHFVTDRTSHFCFSYQFEYIECLHRNALGNFKQFTHEIGLTSAMLIYLDGAHSTKDNPNENYARELYELFTLGEGNGYTEEDIVETAKALTGFFIEGNKYVNCSPIEFKEAQFDESEKIIFGETGNFGYDDVINILFEKKGPLIAKYICTKLYNFFVHPESNNTTAQLIINELSNIFIDNNFDMTPVLKKLFKSQHFFDDACLGVIIKSPFDLFINMSNELNLSYDSDLFSVIQQGTRASGQTIFSPPDVAGWQRNRTWINSNFIISRWTFSKDFLRRAIIKDEEAFKTLALKLSGELAFNTNNPDLISKIIIDYFLPKGLKSDEDYEVAYTVFRSNVSEAYFEGGAEPIWTLDSWPTSSTQVYLLIDYLSQEPQFQLK